MNSAPITYAHVNKSNPTGISLRKATAHATFPYPREGKRHVMIIHMDKVFNISKCKENRKSLRKNMTEAEKILWSCLKTRQLFGIKFRRQYSVGYYILDFYSPQLKLGIELDGNSHEADGKKEYDQERDEYIKSNSIKILRFQNKDIRNNLNRILNEVKSVIKSMQ